MKLRDTDLASIDAVLAPMDGGTYVRWGTYDWVNGTVFYHHRTDDGDGHIVIRCPAFDQRPVGSFDEALGGAEVRTREIQLSKGDRAFITVELVGVEDIRVWWKKLGKDLYIGLERR